MSTIISQDHGVYGIPFYFELNDLIKASVDQDKIEELEEFNHFIFQDIDECIESINSFNYMTENEKQLMINGLKKSYDDHNSIMKMKF